MKGEGEMIFTKKKNEKTNLEKEIDRLSETLSYTDMDTDEYDDIVSKIERLTSIKEKLEKAKVCESKVSKDTLAVVIGNLVGIVLILGYERVNIITSKALSFVIRGRA